MNHRLHHRKYHPRSPCPDPFPAPVSERLSARHRSQQNGVYASAVTLENGKVYCGVTNIGVKPTVGGTKLLSETWMPDFHGGEIYGQTADVRLLDFIRPEKKFDNITELKNAITDNAVTAKEIFDEMYRYGV